MAAAFYPLAFVAEQVGGERIRVIELTPAGVEPHDWEPSPQDVSSIRRAQVLFYQGPGFQPALDRVIRDLTPGKPLVVAASSGVELRRVGQGADMHTWLDPSLLSAATETLRKALAEADPENASWFAARADALGSRLSELDREYRDALAPCQGRGFLTFHDFFTYPASRYGLQAHSMVGLAPEGEPSPERLAELASLVKEGKIRAAFAERGVSTPALESFAREHSLPLLLLDPLEVRPPQGEDYFSVMRENLRSLAEGLGCARQTPGG